MYGKVAGLLSLLGTASFMLSGAPAHAQKEYPVRPVELIAPAPPGGGQDLIMRALAAVGEKYLGQPLVPVNRAGGGGAVGTAHVASAKPDGYTILISSSTSMLAKPLAEKLPYKADDFVSIGRITTTPEIITVPAKSNWKSMKAFVDDAKKNPGKFRYSSGGTFNPEHVLFAFLSRKTGMDLIHIPTSGGGPALIMLLGEHVEISCFFPPVVKPHLASGTLRALAVNSAERLDREFASIPTLKEELGFTAPISWWFAVFAPRATPQPVVQKLRSALKDIAADKEFAKLMSNLSFDIKYMGGEEFEKVFKEQQTSFSELLKSMK